MLHLGQQREQTGLTRWLIPSRPDGYRVADLDPEQRLSGKTPAM